MLFKHYFDKDFTWEEIDALAHAEPGKGSWSFPQETELAKLGLKVRNIEPIDYDRLYAEGMPYLLATVGKDTLDWYLTHSNIESVIQYIPEFQKYVEHETRRATIDEITENLKAGKLVAVEINSRILNKREGVSMHFVLLYDFDGENIILHDPGLPPLPGRKVSLADFEACWNYPGANGEVTIFG